MSENEVSNAVLHALLVQQADTLKEIRADVKAQNGRVGKLEGDMRIVKTVWTIALAAVGVFGDSIKHKLGLP